MECRKLGLHGLLFKKRVSVKIQPTTIKIPINFLKISRNIKIPTIKFNHMNQDIVFHLKNSDSFEEFYEKGYYDIAEDLAKSNGVETDDLFETDVMDYARTLWDEYQNSCFPF